jgi:DNA-binding LytR/AlgR family response regulator
MNCIIIDDEPLAREGLLLLLKSIPEVKVLESFSNAILANHFLQQNDVDLMFIDIEMAVLDGISFVKTLVKRPLVVFVTAYPQYALDSYDVGALDYLVKPVRLERMLKTVNKAKSYKQLIESKFEEIENSVVESQYVFIKSDRRLIKIFFNDILYIEGLKDYVIIHTITQKVITAMNIKNITAKLPETKFTRISKSYVVNTAHIKSVAAHSVMIHNDELPIGNLFKESFYEQFINNKIVNKQ